MRIFDHEMKILSALKRLQHLESTLVSLKVMIWNPTEPNIKIIMRDTEASGSELSDRHQWILKPKITQRF